VRYKIRTVTPAAEIPPLFVIDADFKRSVLKVEHDIDDDLIAEQQLEAMAMVEDFTGQVLTPRVLEMVTCGFPVLPELISLPRDPVTEILSIEYSDPDSGEAIVLDPAGYRWSSSAPDQVLPAFRQSFPIAAAEAGSVRVQFEAGYEDGLCPRPLRSAVKATLWQLYECRGEGGALSTEVMRDLRAYRPLLV
jgi:uncharacterized phiE125 gp8 family phage protein